MNALEQLSSGLIASAQDASRLERASSARILVVSDSHGNRAVLEEILKQCGEDADALVHCGDGAGDLLSLLTDSRSPQTAAKTVPPAVAVVQGNGDADCFPLGKNHGVEDDGEPVRLRFHLERNVCFKAAGMRVFATHGHRYGVDFGPERLSAAASPLGADLIFHGHTHTPSRMEAVSHALVINPGSCSRPRGGFPATFAVVSYPGHGERFQVEFFEIRGKAIIRLDLVV